jgi:hypothetical protein
MTDPTLSPAEISAITGGLVQKQKQLEELHAQGFVRARISHGQLVLERAHYEAVCAGVFARVSDQRDNGRPKVKLVHSA